MRHRATLALLLISSSAGLAQTCLNGVCFVDRAAGGQVTLGNIRGSLGVLDVNADGWMDLVVADVSGKPHRLFVNVPHATIAGARDFQDATVGSGLDDADGVSRGAGGVAIADYDNDGDSDVFIQGALPADLSYGLLYRNDNGHFTNVSVSSGIRLVGSVAESASWADYDLDGRLDLFIAHIQPSPTRFRLLRNLGDGTFADVSGVLPALGPVSHQYSHTWCDLDADGWDECVLINTGPAPVILRSHADMAGGLGGGRVFADVAAAIGYTQLGPAPMGIAAGDYDNDGDFDFAITDAATGTYYRNDAGTMTPTPGLMQSIFGWGTTWIDAENDGDLDNYQAGSWANPNVDRFFLNQGGSFSDISAALNTSSLSSQHLVRVDYTNDQREDVFTINPGTPGQFISVYENVSPAPGHAITIRLVGNGASINRDAVGAVVRVTAGGVARVRRVSSGSSTTATEDMRLHVGLGASATIDRIEVLWPSNASLAHRTDVYAGPIAADQFLTLMPHCVADCDEDADLDIFDFLCFQNEYAEASAYADMEEDGDLDLFDFLAFQDAFAGGC